MVTLSEVSPPAFKLILDELRSGVARLAGSLSAALHAAHTAPGALAAESADSALLASVAGQGSMVLHCLQLLQVGVGVVCVCVCVCCVWPVLQPFT